MQDKEGLHTLQSGVCPQPCSAQLAELVALTKACELSKGKTVHIYTDSAYAHGVCHLFCSTWKARGFRITHTTPRHYHSTSATKIAIIKCAAHKTDNSTITKGNNAAEITTLHEMLTGRPMPSPIFKSHGKGPSLEILEKDM